MPNQLDKILLLEVGGRLDLVELDTASIVLLLQDTTRMCYITPLYQVLSPCQVTIDCFYATARLLFYYLFIVFS